VLIKLKALELKGKLAGLEVWLCPARAGWPRAVHITLGLALALARALALALPLLDGLALAVALSLPGGIVLAIALPLPLPVPVPFSALPCPVSGHLHDLRVHFKPVHCLPMAAGLDLAVFEWYDAYSPYLSKQSFTTSGEMYVCNFVTKLHHSWFAAEQNQLGGKLSTTAK